MFERLGWLVVVCGLLATGCGSEEQAFVGQIDASVVYGSDDRMEVYNHPDAELRDIARESVVALIDENQIERGPDGLYVLFAITLSTSKGLCEGEAFFDQPTAANCSGVLIDDDLVLTAGHCMRTQRNCDDTAFVFNYHLDAPMQLAAIEDDDVYSCTEIVLRDEAPGQTPTPDFAVVRLDRAVSGGHRPAPLRPADDPLSLGESVTMIGFGSGIPAKIDSGGEVADPRTETLDFFVVSSDAFAGHSGSPVFDSSNELAGHLVAGLAPDYVEAEGQQCFVVNTFDESEAGEAINYFAPIVAELCDLDVGSDSLCGDTACDGSPCGVKSPPDEVPGSGGVVPPASSTGCRAVGGEPFPAGWLLVAALLWMWRARRQVV